MKFILSVYSPPSGAGAVSAQEFAKALLSQPHQILQIFFYGDGALNSLEGGFFSSLNVPLLVCSTALFKRNIPKTAMHSGFAPASLTQFFDALFKADRHIAFGN